MTNQRARTVGVDIGATRIAPALVDDDGEIAHGADSVVGTAPSWITAAFAAGMPQNADHGRHRDGARPSRRAPEMSTSWIYVRRETSTGPPLTSPSEP